MEWLKEAWSFLQIVMRHGYRTALMGGVFYAISRWLAYLYQADVDMLTLFHQIDWWGIAALMIYFFIAMGRDLVRLDFGKNDKTALMVAY